MLALKFFLLLSKNRIMICHLGRSMKQRVKELENLLKKLKC